MAHIRERIGRNGTKVYQFIIRRKGFKPVAKTFSRKTDGYAWAQEAEVSMRLGKYHAVSKAADMTVNELIESFVSATFHERRSKTTPLQTLSW
jgi:hypothetical protein